MTDTVDTGERAPNIPKVASSPTSRSEWLAFLLRETQLDFEEIALVSTALMAMDDIQESHYPIVAGMVADRLVGTGFSVNTPRVYVVAKGPSVGRVHYTDGDSYEIAASVVEVVALPRRLIGITSTGNTYSAGEDDTHDLWVKIAKSDEASPDLYISLLDMKSAEQITLE